MLLASRLGCYGEHTHTKIDPLGIPSNQNHLYKNGPSQVHTKRIRESIATAVVPEITTPVPVPSIQTFSHRGTYVPVFGT